MLYIWMWLTKFLKFGKVSAWQLALLASLGAGLQALPYLQFLAMPLEGQHSYYFKPAVVNILSVPTELDKKKLVF